MKTKILSTAVVASVIFIGCGSQPTQPLTADIAPWDIQKTTTPIRAKEISIGSFSGPYPETIKDKELSDGLLNNYYKKIKDDILNKALSNKSIRIGFVIEKGNSNQNTQKIVMGLKRYFAKTGDRFLINFDGVADVKVFIKDDHGLVSFKIRYINKHLFGYQEVNVEQVSETLSQLEKESKSDWSSVSIPTRDGGVAVYKIMKNPVMVSDFYPDKYTREPRAVTQISFSDADNYCFKKYGGSISSLYVFEYAAREGKIVPATKFGATKEMVASFDEANPEDVMLKRPGDVVKLTNDKCEQIMDQQKKIDCYANSDYSNMLIFNFITNKYTNADVDYQSADLTFRCIKKGE